MDFTEAIRAAVAERGRDYRYTAHYPVCNYVVGDLELLPEDPTAAAPGCIVGLALHKMGVPLDVLAGYENLPAVDVLAAVAPDMPREQVQGAGAAQSMQDGGRLWGEALDAYEEWLS